MKPPLTCVEEYRQYARTRLDANALAFFESGADDEYTLQDSRDVFSRYTILPRVLAGVSPERCLSTTILGHPVNMPVCVCPVAAQQLAHPDGEVGSARAAASVGTVFGLSLSSNMSMETVREEAGDGVRLLQLLALRDRQLMVELVQRAERCGYNGLVYTADHPVRGKKRAEDKVHFHIPPHLQYSNANWNSLIDSSATWEYITWLKSITHLPIVIKGILNPEDALLAVEAGVSAIQVSCHGARQLDTTITPLDALPGIVRAVQGRCEVYMDGGVRSGTDVFKALALGATAVFVGRPIIYGLAYDGENGVRQVLELLRDELSSTMGLTGCSTLADITKDFLVTADYLNAKI